MSGPIIRTGTTPKFWANYDRIFTGKEAAPAAKSVTKAAPTTKTVKKASKKTAEKAPATPVAKAAPKAPAKPAAKAAPKATTGKAVKKTTKKAAR